MAEGLIPEEDQARLNGVVDDEGDPLFALENISRSDML